MHQRSRGRRPLESLAAAAQATGTLAQALVVMSRNKRPILRVGAGANGDGLSLRAIQEEVAKKGAAKRSGKWSAFNFQAFSVSSLTDVLQKEGIEDAQAAITHASVQVQVRSQLIVHMNKEIATEASAALTAVQSAAKAAKEAATKADAAVAAAGDAYGRDERDADGGDANTDEQRLAESWECAFLRLRRLVDKAARQQSASGTASPDAPSTSTSDDAPVNLHLDELAVMLQRSRRRTTPRRTLHRPVPPPASVDGLGLLERWEAEAREADAAGAVAAADSDVDATADDEAVGDANASMAVDSATLLPDAAPWWQLWPADVIAAQAPSAQSAGALMAQWLPDDGTSGCEAGWEDEDDELMAMAADDDEHGDSTVQPEPAMTDECEAGMDLFADDGLCLSPHPSPSPSPSPARPAHRSHASPSGDDVAPPDRDGLPSTSTHKLPPPAAHLGAEADSVASSDEDAFESTLRRAPAQSEQQRAVAAVQAARRRRVVMSDDDDSDVDAQPTAKHAPAQKTHRTPPTASQAHMSPPAAASALAISSSFANTPGTSSVIDIASGASSAARATPAARPFALLIDFGLNGERSSAPPPEPSAAARKPFKLATDHEKYLLPANLLAEPAAPTHGLLPVPTKGAGSGGSGVAARQGRAAGTCGAVGGWQFVLPPAACDVKRRGAGIFSRLLSEDNEVEGWLQNHKRRRWQQSREEAAAPHLAAFDLREKEDTGDHTAAAAAATDAQHMISGCVGDSGDGGDGASVINEGGEQTIDGNLVDAVDDKDGDTGGDGVAACAAVATLGGLLDLGPEEGHNAFDSGDADGGGFGDSGGFDDDGDFALHDGSGDEDVARADEHSLMPSPAPARSIARQPPCTSTILPAAPQPFGAPPARASVPSASGLTHRSTIRTLAEWVAPHVTASAADAPVAFSQLLRDASAPAFPHTIDAEDEAEQHSAAAVDKNASVAVEAPSAQRLFLSLLWMVNNHNHTVGRGHVESSGANDDTALGQLPRGRQLDLKVSGDGRDILLGVQA